MQVHDITPHASTCRFDVSMLQACKSKHDTCTSWNMQIPTKITVVLMADKQIQLQSTLMGKSFKENSEQINTHL